MPGDEELTQRRYVTADGLRGDPFGIYEQLNIGATNLAALVRAGLTCTLAATVEFPFVAFRPPARVAACRPDRLVCRRDADGFHPVAVLEHKAPAEIDNERKKLAAAEQALFYGIALGVPLAAFTNDTDYWYVDVAASVEAGEVVYADDRRPWNPGVIASLLSGDTDAAKDPTALAESVWQMIWHATKAEPKECLLTFVEIFMLKFLSDNLPATVLPESHRFYELLLDERTFRNRHGKLPIDYYITDIRPRVKSLFPDNVLAVDPGLHELFGLSTVVSKTSVINGFAFLTSSSEGIATFNTAFVDILQAFNLFGPLTTIDPEFKLRLYETFLRRSARQQRLGQFFTPRNIVQPMIRMARLGELPDDAVVLDPAAGVGGFVLEPLLFPDALEGNIEFQSGRPTRRVRTVGVDVDSDLHILAKANMLLHLAEAVRDPASTIQGLNQAMADTFVLMNENQTLGALLNPPRGQVDAILTNPPYVTQGSSVYRRAVAEIDRPRNGTDLHNYYDTGGLGIEAFFLRYITGALKPGGEAFVIVPLGLLNRSEPRPKRHLLSECNIVASIALPRRAFFNTPQPTYILVLERRHTEVDPRPDVFCGLARTIGETLDHRRTPTPGRNDLADIAEAFVAWKRGDTSLADASPVIKSRPATDFTAEDRWDVTRFWTDDELVALGVRTPPTPRTDFLEEAAATVSELVGELTEAKETLESLTPSATTTVSLDDETLWWIRPGKRITHNDLLAHPGDLPVYSCFTRAHMEKGRVDEAWVKELDLPIIEEPCVTVNATGASGVGIVFVREDRCVLTDDVIAISPLTDQIDLYYLAAALRSAVAEGDFQYEAKLYQGRVRALTLEFPVTDDGEFDLDLQRQIGLAVRRVEALQDRLSELGQWARSARLTGRSATAEA